MSGCRCLLLDTRSGFVLIDSGFGYAELQSPGKMFGKAYAQALNVSADADLSAIAYLKSIGVDRSDVRHIICTHLDVDHAGGLVDFPHAAIHTSALEQKSLLSGDKRYVQRQFAHGPKWVNYGGPLGQTSIGLPGWQLYVDTEVSLRLVPLYGHTVGHCGILIETEGGVLLHTGDSYYRRGELNPGHPHDTDFPLRTAVSNNERLATLDRITALLYPLPSVVIFCTHHLSETTTLNRPQLLRAAGEQVR